MGDIHPQRGRGEHRSPPPSPPPLPPPHNHTLSPGIHLEETYLPRMFQGLLFSVDWVSAVLRDGLSVFIFSSSWCFAVNSVLDTGAGSVSFRSLLLIHKVALPCSWSSSATTSLSAEAPVRDGSRMGPPSLKGHQVDHWVKTSSWGISTLALLLLTWPIYNTPRRTKRGSMFNSGNDSNIWHMKSNQLHR